MPHSEIEDASPDPEPDSRPLFLLLHVPSASEPLRYQPFLVRLAARFRDVLVVATVGDGAMPTPPGMCGPAFILSKSGHIVAEAFGDLPFGELVRLVEHALPPARPVSGGVLTAA